MRLSIIGAILLSIIAMQSKADGIRLGTPSYGGTGCPAGSASVTISPDESAISVLFDTFVAEAGGVTGKRIDRKSCNLTIPILVPQGYSVATSFDLKGFISIPYDGYSKLNVEYFLDGIRGPRSSRIFRGAVEDNYIHHDDVITSSLIWSPCGQSVNLRVNISTIASTNSSMKQTLSVIETGIIDHFQWKSCY